MAGRENTVVEVLFPYSAAEKNQISLQPRERICVLEKDKSGWWIGRRDATGEVGIFPSTYVRETPDRLKFNRPKELKPLSMQGGGQEQTTRISHRKEKDLKAELGFSDEEGDESPEERRRDSPNMREIRKRMHDLALRKDDLERRYMQEHDDRLRVEKETKEKSQQLAIVKRQNMVLAEEIKQVKYDLEDAYKEIRQEGGRIPSPPYRQTPDEAVRGWLEGVLKERCEEDREKIRDLERQVEKLEREKEKADSSDDMSTVGSPTKDKEKSKAKVVSPRRATMPQASTLPSGRIRKNDWVRLLQGVDEQEQEPGVLRDGAEGFVCDVIPLSDSPDGKPFCVRSAGDPKLAGRTWFSESVLEFVRAEPTVSAAPTAPAPDADVIKDKDKKIRKLEKKAKVLEEDLNALEKYNGKLEKKLEKLKKQAASGGGEGPTAEEKAEASRLKKELASKGDAPASPEVKEEQTAALQEARRGLQAAEEELAMLRQERAAGAGLQDELDKLRAKLQESDGGAEDLKKQLLDAAAKAESAGKAAETAEKAEAEARHLAVEAQAKADAQVQRAIKDAETLRKQLGDWTAEKEKLEAQAEMAEKKAAEVIAANEAELKHAVDRYKREEKRRRELYNQLMDLKGNIRVYCRLKPCIGTEVNECISFDDDMTVRVKDPQTQKETTYEFDLCLPEKCGQEDVYRDVKGLAVSVLDGYYVCIFAYGQTGSGKTYTMEGPPSNRGVNFRTVEDLFVHAEERKAEYEYKMAVSILEVYNDGIFDLQGKRCSVKVTSVKDEVRIEPLVRTPVESTEQVAAALAAAYEHRSVGQTEMNAHSSRSHCVLSVWIEGKNKATGAKIRGKLHLIDLAGSERLKQSQAEGERLVEATHINKSLSALGLCINSLANKKSHIPYRNSRLTALLQDSLGGNCKCLMFANISPSTSNVSETISTLNFATGAKKVDLGKAEKLRA